MDSTTSDLELYYKHITNRLVGISSIYVDVILETGARDFMNFTKLTKKDFSRRKPSLKTQLHGNEL